MSAADAAVAGAGGGPPRSPRVTVLLPVYNGLPYLGRALESAFQQTLADFELLVIDDGSTDGSSEVLGALRDPRVRVIRNAANLGLTVSLNRGIAEARAPLVARLDADDLAELTRLEKQVAFLDANPAIAMVGSAVGYVDATDRTFMAFAFPTEPDAVDRTLLHWCCFSHSCVTFRKSAVESVGGYRTSIAHAQDYDLWLRLSERFLLANLPEILGRYRVHAGQISHTGRKLQRALANQCRYEAAVRRHRLGRLNDPEAFAPPGIVARMLGRENTLGADGVRWARIYRRMRLPDRSLHHALVACVDSPFSAEAYGAAAHALFELVVPHALRRRLSWYSTRLRDFMGRHGVRG